MTSARVWASHVRLQTLELVRMPAYLVPTLAFPLMLFLFFAVPYAVSTEGARFLTASYAAFAVMGVTLFQFGVGIAAERATSWEVFMRILPVGRTLRFAARITSALAFAAASATLVIIAATVLTKFHPTPILLLRLYGALLAGGIPLALLGITIGYWSSPKAALPIANIVYIPLALGGGLWLPPQFLPHFIAVVSPYLPSRHYGELVWAAVLNQQFPMKSWLWLAGYAVVFALLAVWGYRRDEGQHFT